jgi:hypothetical protein
VLAGDRPSARDMSTHPRAVILSAAWPDGEPQSARDTWDKQQDISRDNRQAQAESGYPGQVTAHLSADLREVRRQYSPAERQRIAAQRDMTPGAPHPNPVLAGPWLAGQRLRHLRPAARSCDWAISDRGLIAGPADDELGHAENCPRHAAAIAEWNAGWEAEP